MHYRMSQRRPSDELAFVNMQGHKIQQGLDAMPRVWWTKADVPPFILQSAQGSDRGYGVFDMFGLAREAARLHIRALVKSTSCTVAPKFLCCL